MIQQFQISFNKFKTMAKKTNWRWLWYLLVIIVISSIWYGSYYWINRHCGDADGPGTFGDQFGAVNALFTGLSLAGIIITLWQQHQELNAQRREFMTNRATNQLYQQVNLINSAFSNLKYYLYKKEFPIGEQLTGFEGNAAYNVIIEDFEKIKEGKIDKNATMSKIVGQTGQLLRITTNSVKLLKRIREIENMSEEDAQLLYETFKYNIDSRIWDLIHNLNLINRSEIDPKISDEYEYEVHKILEFKVEFTRLNNLVKGS